jgi:cytochrome c oxidase subunit 3
MIPADTRLAPLAPHFSSREQEQGAAKFGMWVFIASELLFFGPMLVAYLYLRLRFPDGWAIASRHTDFMLGTLNTAVLLSSSLLMALASRAAEAQRRHAAWLLAATAGLGLVFLALKGTEYHKEFGAGLFPGAGFTPTVPGAELFFILYFALTGLHAVHLCAGIAVSLRLAVGLRRPAPDGTESASVELIGLYWHFVDVVWIFLYPLLYLVGRARG